VNNNNNNNNVTIVVGALDSEPTYDIVLHGLGTHMTYSSAVSLFWALNFTHIDLVQV
jgi:hypothetical protein